MPHPHARPEMGSLTTHESPSPEAYQTPLVNLAVEQLPTPNYAKDYSVASMILHDMDKPNLIPVADKGQGTSSTDDFADFMSNFPEKYQMLKDNAKMLRLELCLPENATLEQIGEKLNKLRQGQISPFSCRKA